MKFRFVLIAALLLVLPFATSNAQEPAPSNSSQRYLVLSTFKLKTLQKELDQATAAGYHVIFGDASHKILVLEKTTDKFEYRVVDDVKKDFNAAVADNFHVVPATFSLDKGRTMIMEKPAGATDTHDYELLDTVRTSTMQKELNEWAAKGYELCAMDTYGADFVLMEKTSPNAPPVPDRYLLLATEKTSTMQKEIDAAVAKGFQIVSASGGKELIVILEKSAASAPGYLLLATARSSTLEKEINENAAKGYQPLPRTLLAITKQNSFLSGFVPNEVVIIMEKVAAPPQFAYKIIGTSRVGTFEKELAQAAGERFDMIGMTLTYSEQVALMQRPAAAPEVGAKTSNR